MTGQAVETDRRAWVEEIVALAEGNIGAATVLRNLTQEQLACVRKTKLRGPGIWVAYKYGCSENIVAFLFAIAEFPDLLEGLAREHGCCL